jgi:dephospho-CoA kinase
MNAQTTSYVLHEAALIFEAGVNKRLDHVIGVFAPLSVRINRVMERDKVSKEDVLQRIDRQMDEGKKMKLCDFILQNDEQQLLLPQVMELHKKLLALSNQQLNG